MLDSLSQFVESAVDWFCGLPWPTDSLLTFPHNVMGMLAILLVCLVCGAVGALVVGNRMAFFSDALAHCAFAGVAVGIVLCSALNVSDQNVRDWILPIMVLFGIGIGLLIAYVRESTQLASDTVIGVFYAAAIGFGAVIMSSLAGRRFLNIESFIFGAPTGVRPLEIVWLLLLLVGTAVFLFFTYNALVLASANQSLAVSRRVPARLHRYLFVILLGLMVNLSLLIVGTLLINGLLIVPAAAAANLARNLRQMFWLSVTLAVTIGLGGYVLSWEIGNRVMPIGTSGTIIVLAVLVFAASAVVGNWLRRRPASAKAA